MQLSVDLIAAYALKMVTQCVMTDFFMKLFHSAFLQGARMAAMMTDSIIYFLATLNTMLKQPYRYPLGNAFVPNRNETLMCSSASTGMRQLHQRCPVEELGLILEVAYKLCQDSPSLTW